MPGPAHGGILHVVGFEPGAGAAGEEHTILLGDYAEDMVLIGAYRDVGDAGGAAGEVTMTIVRSADRSKYAICSSLRSDSDLFSPRLAGGRIELGVPVPAGDQVKFTVRYSGALTVKWFFVFAPPPLSDVQVLRTLQEAQQYLTGSPERS